MQDPLIKARETRKPRSGVDAENKLNDIFGKRYCINLDHQILTDHGVFYPQQLYNDLVFELTLAPASHVVKGSDANAQMRKCPPWRPKQCTAAARAL